MSYPTSPFGDVTPADPGAIDLEPYKEFATQTTSKLIAAVEALRARIAIKGLPCACRFHGVEGAIRQGSETGVLVDPDEPVEECALHKALRERVAELGNVYADSEEQREYDAKAAEARVAELEAIVEQVRAANEHWHTRVTQLKPDTEALEARVAELAGALEFYADPNTYFAISFLPDSPCGDFMDDFEELEGELGHPDGGTWMKPGKKARAAGNTTAALGRGS